MQSTQTSRFTFFEERRDTFLPSPKFCTLFFLIRMIHFANSCDEIFSYACSDRQKRTKNGTQNKKEKFFNFILSYNFLIFFALFLSIIAVVVFFFLSFLFFSFAFSFLLPLYISVILASGYPLIYWYPGEEGPKRFALPRGLVCGQIKQGAFNLCNMQHDQPLNTNSCIKAPSSNFHREF